MDLEKKEIEKLRDDIFEELKKMKSKGKYAIINRMIKGDFYEQFGDALFSYNRQIILAERLFKLNTCKTDKVQVYEASDEMVKIHKEFTTFMESLGDKMSEETMVESQDKMNEFQSKFSQMAPEIKLSDALVYPNSYTGENLIMTRLTDIPEDSLKAIANQMALFAYNFYSFILMLNPNLFNFSVKINDLGPDADYVDLLIENKLKSGV